MRQSRPHGQWFPISSEWKADIDERLHAKGWTRAELARRLKCEASAVTNLFRPNTHLSRLVRNIHQLLDLPPPLPLARFNESLYQIAIAWPILPKADQARAAS